MKPFRLFPQARNEPTLLLLQAEKEYAKLNADKQQHKRTYDNLGSKFQDVQKKWFAVDQSSPEPQMMTSSTTDSSSTTKNNRRIPSGSTPVKSLMERFDNNAGGDANILHNESEILRNVVNEQRREIETLRSQLAAKDERIRQLEMRMKETVLISSDFEVTKA